MRQGGPASVPRNLEAAMATMHNEADGEIPARLVGLILTLIGPQPSSSDLHTSLVRVEGVPA